MEPLVTADPAGLTGVRGYMTQSRENADDDVQQTDWLPVS